MVFAHVQYFYGRDINPKMKHRHSSFSWIAGASLARQRLALVLTNKAAKGGATGFHKSLHNLNIGISRFTL